MIWIARELTRLCGIALILSAFLGAAVVVAAMFPGVQ